MILHDMVLHDKVLHDKVLHDMVLQGRILHEFCIFVYLRVGYDQESILYDATC